MGRSRSRFYRVLGVLPSAILAALLTLATPCRADQFTLTQGTAPILVVAPHAGSNPLKGAPKRVKDRSRDPRFSTSRDLVTGRLASQLVSHFPEENRPSLLVSHIHRKYADLNRPLELGTQSQAAVAFHREFHRNLRDELSRIREEHGWVLLLDIHGQGSIPVDAIIGTRKGETIGPWSERLLWGNDGLFEELEELSYTTQPKRANAHYRYGGGFIVKHYGQDPQTEAWQIEHGRHLRFRAKRNLRYTKILARHIERGLRCKETWFKP